MALRLANSQTAGAERARLAFYADELEAKAEGLERKAAAS